MIFYVKEKTSLSLWCLCSCDRNTSVEHSYSHLFQSFTTIHDVLYLTFNVRVSHGGKMGKKLVDKNHGPVGHRSQHRRSTVKQLETQRK